MFGNWVKTSILFAGIIALFGAIGAAIGGAQGMLIALLFGAGMNLFAYWNSDRMVLSMYHAREVDAGSGGRYYAMVQELSTRAGLPMPRVYVIDEAQPNAFATGRNPEHAAVAATTGIMQLLSERELRGVMAHELTHVKNRDTLISTSRRRSPARSRRWPTSACFSAAATAKDVRPIPSWQSRS